MEAPGQPHVKVWRGDIYIERVPNAWVLVTTQSDWRYLDHAARNYVIARALKTGLDFALPTRNPEPSGE